MQITLSSSATPPVHAGDGIVKLKVKPPHVCARDCVLVCHVGYYGTYLDQYFDLKREGGGVGVKERDIEVIMMGVKPEIGMTSRYIGVDHQQGSLRFYPAEEIQKFLDPRSNYNVRITFERIHEKGIARFCEETGEFT